MKDMALSASEAKEDTMLCPSSTDDDGGPKYPYGLCLDLNDDSLKKLGLDASKLNIGDEIAVTAVAKVTRISRYEEQKDVDNNVGLQITTMEANLASGDAAKKLYGN